MTETLLIGAHRILVGDVRRRLRDLPDGLYQCVVTSPPYWGLRDYGTGAWVGGDAECSHASTSGIQGASGDRSDRTFTGEKPQGQTCSRCGATRIDEQIGLEASVEGYVAAMVEVFREVRRVLRDDGVLWLNLGDSYSGSWSGNSMRPDGGTQRDGAPGFQPLDDRVPGRNGAVPTGLKPKDLIGVPWMVATALRADGWWLRAALPWVKRNPMPDSVTDRPGSGGVETVFMLAKRPRYFYDAVAVRRAAQTSGRGSENLERTFDHTPEPGIGAGVPWENSGSRSLRCSDLFYSTFPRAMGLIPDDDGTPTALDVNSRGFKEAHFATFPPELVEPLIQAGTSERGCCPACGAAWVRIESATGWTPSCACDTEPVPCRVLDPFAGSGTVGAVCEELGRVFDGIELNPEYAEMAIARIGKSIERAGLFVVTVLSARSGGIGR